MTHPAPVQATPPHRPLIDDTDFTLFVGDAISVLRGLPDESVHHVVTSPPYWGLRDYGTGEWSGGDPDCDHKQETRHQVQGATSQRQGRTNTEEQRNENFRDICGKCGATRTDQQLGLEPTPEAYVARMVEVFREVRRVLRRDGTCWLNLGDSYATMRNDHAGGGFGKAGGAHEQSTAVKRGWHGGDDLKPKDLCGIPWRVAFALQADGWYLRSEIIWAKPNPMPESVTDRPTKSHEQVFLLTRSPRYYFDQESIREPHTPDGRTKTIHAHAVDNSHENYANMGTDQERWPNGGRNARSVWNIATQPYAEAHFATFPEELPRRCIAAGTSERGCCPECGAPWEREIERGPVAPEPEHRNPAKRLEPHQAGNVGEGNMGFRASRLSGQEMQRWKAEHPDKTTGWRPTCDHGGVDLTIIDTPTGERAGDDPSLTTGRAGMNRPRGDNEGRRPITRYEQAKYARQLRSAPTTERMRMQSQAGSAWDHYIRTDTSGARPVPAELLERWISNGWLEHVEIPEHTAPDPVPCVVLDPFMGSGTVALVARKLGRRSIGIELNPDYAQLAARRLQQLSLLA